MKVKKKKKITAKTLFSMTWKKEFMKLYNYEIPELFVNCILWHMTFA